jgi:hypothetical protein
MLGKYQVATQVMTSQVALSSIELVNFSGPNRIGIFPILSFFHWMTETEAVLETLWLQKLAIGHYPMQWSKLKHILYFFHIILPFSDFLTQNMSVKNTFFPCRMNVL